MALSTMAFLAMTGCASDSGKQVASDGEASNLEEALFPGVLSPNPCTKVKMVAPRQHFHSTVGVPVVLTAVAKCPPGQTPEYQYWKKRFRDPNWTPIVSRTSYVAGSSIWIPPTDEHWCVTVVVRAMGVPEDYQARANARCTAPRCGDGDVEAGEQCDDGNMVNGDGCDNSCMITGTESVYVKASNTGVGDIFGYSVAMSADGSTLAVGAPYEASGAIGIDGNQINNSARYAGAVYIFMRSSTTWSQQAYIKASNTGVGDEFGYGVALSTDGSTLAVGAPGEASAATGIDGNQGSNSARGAGAVYMFTRSGTTWSQQAYVKAANTRAGDNFGHSVALSVDGSTLAVGAPGEASAIGIDSSQANKLALNSGAIYMFTRSGTVWSQQAYVKASNSHTGDYFGAVVAISEDASTVAVGAPGEDSAATGIGGNEGDNSASSAGAVYVFTCNGTTWNQEAYIKASNTDAYDYFGWKIALSANGRTLAVGAPGERSAARDIGGDQYNRIPTLVGAVYLFANNDEAWSQQAYVKASNPDTGDFFGYGVALSADGSSLVVGAPGEASAATGIGGDQDDNSELFAGAVYRFTRSGTTWSQAAYIKASNTDANDDFGYDIALSASGMTLAVSAPGEAGAATGIGGNQADNSAASAGAVYVFP